MTRTMILLTASLALTASVAFAAAGDRRNAEQPSAEDAAARNGAPAQMSTFDYFFNNPDKYRTIRNDPANIIRACSAAKVCQPRIRLREAGCGADRQASIRTGIDLEAGVFDSSS